MGRPIDEVNERTHRLPLPVRRLAARALLQAYVGRNSAYGLPEPDHRVFESHLLVNSRLLYHLRHGDLTVQPDVEELRGDRYQSRLVARFAAAQRRAPAAARRFSVVESAPSPRMSPYRYVDSPRHRLEIEHVTYERLLQAEIDRFDRYSVQRPSTAHPLETVLGDRRRGGQRAAPVHADRRRDAPAAPGSRSARLLRGRRLRARQPRGRARTGQCSSAGSAASGGRSRWTSLVSAGPTSRTRSTTVTRATRPTWPARWTPSTFVGSTWSATTWAAGGFWSTPR
jgi:hypothetical protein